MVEVKTKGRNFVRELSFKFLGNKYSILIGLHKYAKVEHHA